MSARSEEPSNRIHRLKYKAIGFDTDNTVSDFQCSVKGSPGFTVDRILGMMTDCDLAVDKTRGTKNQVAEEMKKKATDCYNVEGGKLCNLCRKRRCNH